MRWRIVVVAVSAVGLVAAGCSDDSDEVGDATTTTVEQVAGDEAAQAELAAEPVPPPTSAPPEGGYDVPLGWVLEESFDGLLDDPVAVGDGFAAVHTAEDPESVGELWTSTDGSEWEPAPDPPPGSVQRLTAHGGNLFVEFDTGLWARQHSDGWREVISFDGIYRPFAAVGPERVVVYSQGGGGRPFGVVGVFDTASLDPVDFDPLPASDVEGFVGEGRVVALDDGFLADWTEWFRFPGLLPDEDPGESASHLVISGDGSAWAEHPTATTETVDVWATTRWNGPATYNGLNLVADPDGRLLVTDDGLEFTRSEMFPPFVTAVATDGGFFALNFRPSNLPIGHSTDGVEWQSVQPPPTWVPSATLPTDNEFASGTVLMAGDDLVAFVHRGDVEPWGMLEDQTTEIWRSVMPEFVDVSPSSGTFNLALDPTVLPAAPGPAEVSVTGTAPSGFGNLFVMACPDGEGPAAGEVRPSCESFPTADEEEFDELRDQGMFVWVTPEDSGFSTMVSFEVDQAMIDKGEVLIIAGDYTIVDWATLPIGGSGG
jgi:hypothetical protein